MSGKLTTIIYDNNKLPLPPNVTSYEIWEGSSELTVKAVTKDMLRDEFNEFLYRIPEVHQPKLPRLPDGDYTLHVSVEGDQQNPSIIYGLQNNSTSVFHAGFSMSQSKFVEDFYFATAGMSQAKMEEYEMPWSVEFIKGVFGKDLIGTEEFWNKFTGDLDVVLVPVNLAMGRAQDGLEVKPIVVDLSHATAVIEQ